MAVILATAGFDHKIRFWEASREKCTRLLRHPDSQVNALSITYDKRFIAAAGNPHARIFDIQSQNNNPLISYDAHQGNVTCVGFQCDAKWMFTGSEDRTIRIWDLRAPRWQRQYECDAPVNSVVLHPNQTELISGDQGGNVRVWDLQANACMQEIVPDGDVPIRSVDIAGDASTVVAGNNLARVFAWQPTSSEEYTAKSLTDTRHDGFLLKCVISPDATRVVTCSSDKTVKIWSLDAHSDEEDKADLERQAAALSAEGGAGADVRLEQVKTLEESAPPPTPAGTTSPPAPPVVSPGSSSSVGRTVPQSTGLALEKTLTAHQRWVWDACFSADSAYLVTASSDYTAKLWDVQTGEVIRHYAGQMAVTCVALNDSAA